MSLPIAFGLYFICWWLVFFVMLPIGVDPRKSSVWMLITRPRRAGGVTVCKYALTLDPNRMLNAPSSVSSGINTAHVEANGTANSSAVNPIAPTKIRRRVTRPRLAISSAEPTLSTTRGQAAASARSLRRSIDMAGR